MSFRTDKVRGRHPITPRKGISERQMQNSRKNDTIVIGKSKGKIAYKDILGRTHHAKPNSLVTQTILFNKDKFSKSQAIAWLKDHGHATFIDEKKNVYRARQVSPSKFRDEPMSTFHPEYLPTGIQFVGGKLKK